VLIHTERLTLRHFTEHDFDALHSWQSRDDVTRHLLYSARSADEVRAALKLRVASRTIRLDGDTLAFLVLRNDNGAAVGEVNINLVAAEHRAGEIGYVLHPSAHGNGFATEAAREMLRIGFEELRLHRIVGRLDAVNTASARVLEKLGMRKEAHLVDNEWLKGEWSSEAVYAMLSREWFAGERATEKQ
jgi:RimJ/RimL family protein N-acetyltransferase